MREDRNEGVYSLPQPANENISPQEKAQQAQAVVNEKKLSDLAFAVSKAKLKLLLRRLWKSYAEPENTDRKAPENFIPETRDVKQTTDIKEKLTPIILQRPDVTASAETSAKLQKRISRFKNVTKNKSIQRNNMTVSEKIKEKFDGFYREYSEAVDFIKTSLSALALALLIRSLLVQPFNIPSESMSPTLLVGDYIFVNKFSYGYSRYSLPFAPNLFSGRLFYTEPNRGDAAVFRVPADGQKDYIKRIVGLPGDQVQVKDGKLFLNGKALAVAEAGNFEGPSANPDAFGASLYQETITTRDGEKIAYLTMDTRKHGVADDTAVFTVPEDMFFVMGDNRDNSQDSRFVYGPVGFVHKDHLIGKAFTIFLSLEDCGMWQIWKLPTCVRGSRFFQSL